MDIVLKDQEAVIEAIERDFEDRVHVAVTLLDDPGRDLGLDRYPGHRFFALCLPASSSERSAISPN
jgi:hydrogenase maturation protease